MSIDSAFKTECIKDATIADITDELTYAVVSGASSTTYQRFTPSSNSNSSLSWSVQLPSESIVMGRDVLLSTDMVLTINCGNATLASQYAVPIGQPAFSYGVDSAFAPFPFSQLISTASAQINNTAVSVNLSSIFAQLLAMNDREFLTAFNSTCPSYPDGDYGSYADGLATNNNPLAAYGNAGYDNQLLPRGSYPVSMVVAHQIFGGGVDTSLISTSVQDTWVITLTISVTEPIFLSPFMWSDSRRNAQGLVGINNFSLTLNMSPPGSVYQVAGPFVGIPQTKCFSSASTYISSITAGSNAGGSMFSSPQLLLRFLSTQPSDFIESKAVCPFSDIPRYITPPSNTTAITSGSTVSLTTQNIQINQIPSKFIIVVRLPQEASTIQQPSTFLTVNSISVNLNNASGLLSSATNYDLWKIARKNGSNQTWLQFKGTANKVGLYTAGEYGLEAVATGGSMIVLDPAIDLSLPESLSNGSLGSYNFQINMNVTNQYGYTITPEVVIMCVNDGILVTNQGTSTTYTGILTRQMVMDAKKMNAIPMTEEVRMIGGRFQDMGLVRHASKRMPLFHKMAPAEHKMKSFSHLLK